MRRTLMVLAMATGIALLTSGVAAAQSSTDFEGLPLGTVNEKDGWTSAPPGGGVPSPTGEFDQAIVANSGAPAAFGTQSLRMSNRWASGAFDFQTYSGPVTPAAGENQANTVYDARFSFISTRPQAQQPGLYMTISPDNGQGGRMSWIDMRDTDEGIRVDLSDASGAGGKFVTHHAGVLSREEPHTIRFWIKVIEGPANDLMRLFIDGEDLGDCFTTWEGYYRNLGQAVPMIDRLQFRLSVPWPEPLADAGYLFDNVTATTSSSASTECTPDGDDSGGGDGAPDVVIDKTTNTRSAEPGDLITYQISVRNRGDAAARGLRACDLPPRALRFVRATRRLERGANGRRCLTIQQLDPGQQRTFRATFQLRAGVSADTISNGSSASVSVASAPVVAPPERPSERPRRRVHDRDAAAVRVVAGQTGGGRGGRQGGVTG